MAFLDIGQLACLVLCSAMRIQLSEDIYDYLEKFEPKFVVTYRGLRNVLVSNLLVARSQKILVFMPFINNNNNNIVICKAHKVSSNAESEAPAVARSRSDLPLVGHPLTPWRIL